MYVDSQDSHAESEPEVLLSDDAKTIWIPRMRVEVVAVSEHHKHPGYSVESKSAAYVYNLMLLTRKKTKPTRFKSAK